ncbi:hypothetical protein INS49_006412 [Diaporthe citri]|uniref:uncharacterized protein n=1 Tax=Diaporthe citri TaxID=83186 RepID=UPI001C81A928|nr:uncharacterized protein INS49_006412 [Diaporthe citri]KAG6364808.1 hypothetical protein INS49_006412 [Diaporthe citri]
MDSFETCEARSFRNVGNVKFVLEKVDGNDAKVMIIAPYEVQRNLYMYELRARPLLGTWYSGFNSTRRWTCSFKSTSRQPRSIELYVTSAMGLATRDQRAQYRKDSQLPSKKPQEAKKPEETSSTAETASTVRTARNEREKSRKTNWALKKMFRDIRKGPVDDDATEDNDDAEQPNSSGGNEFTPAADTSGGNDWNQAAETSSSGWGGKVWKDTSGDGEATQQRTLLEAEISPLRLTLLAAEVGPALELPLDSATINRERASQESHQKAVDIALQAHAGYWHNPKGRWHPFKDQLPAFAVFDTNEQYYVTVAIGNQQEKKFHDRQHV